MTPFEKHLAQTPMRELPPEWRERILPQRRPAQSRYGWLAQWREFLWPSPMAWGALAAVWLVVAVLNFSGPRGDDLYVGYVASARPVKSDPADPVGMWQLKWRYAGLNGASGQQRIYLLDINRL